MTTLTLHVVDHIGHYACFVTRGGKKLCLPITPASLQRITALRQISWERREREITTATYASAEIGDLLSGEIVPYVEGGEAR